MDIAEVARKTGLKASTLRYYEEKGLIRSVGRDGLRRQFGPQVLNQLALIALGQAAGLSLDEIGAMILPDGKANIDRKMLAEKAEELNQTIRRLRAVSRGLAHAAVCPAPSHAACPTFQKLLAAASSGALSTPSRRPTRGSPG